MIYLFFHWGAMITIRWTKTIQYQQRVLRIPIMRIHNHPPCPVQAFFHYFSICPQVPSDGPIFMYPGARNSYTKYIVEDENSLRFAMLSWANEIKKVSFFVLGFLFLLPTYSLLLLLWVWNFTAIFTCYFLMTAIVILLHLKHMRALSYHVVRVLVRVD